MNSVEAYKGFITFLILCTVLGLSLFGFRLINKSSNVESSAKGVVTEEPKQPKDIPIEDPANATTPSTTDSNLVAPVILENNEDQITEKKEAEPNTIPDDKNPEIQNTKTEDVKTGDDFDGFESSNSPVSVLGKNTDYIGENISKEFKDAVLYQDLRYDFNADDKVDTNDYPLFINFILNQED